MTTASCPPPLLAVENLCRRFDGGGPAVDRVSFTLAQGELLALLGPSGCGKTTTLRMIAGLENPDAGDLRLQGTSISGRRPERRGIGLVFQDYALFPHLTVNDNVAFGLHRWPKAPGRPPQRGDAGAGGTDGPGPSLSP